MTKSKTELVLWNAVDKSRECYDRNYCDGVKYIKHQEGVIAWIMIDYDEFADGDGASKKEALARLKVALRKMFVERQQTYTDAIAILDAQ